MTLARQGHDLIRLRAGSRFCNARVAPALFEAGVVVTRSAAQNASELHDRDHGNDEGEKRQKIDFAIHRQQLPGNARANGAFALM